MTVLNLEKALGNNQALIVNSGMEITGAVDWQRAVNLVMSDEAYILLERSDGSMVRSPSVEVPKPLVVQLKKYVRSYYRDLTEQKNVSYKAIFARDKWTCQYCGKKGNTIDHIMPKSRGGLNTWENLCVACFSCNSSKSNKTPEEAGMKIPSNYGVKEFDTLQTAMFKDLQMM